MFPYPNYSLLFNFGEAAADFKKAAEGFAQSRFPAEEGPFRSADAYEAKHLSIPQHNSIAASARRVFA